MKYRKGLALLLAAALTMSIAPQTGIGFGGAVCAGKRAGERSSGF